MDAGSSSSAESGRVDELAFFATHSPPPNADEAFFSHGGTPVTGDVWVRTQRAVGLRTASRAAAEPVVARRPRARAGTALRMARSGEADARAAAAVYRRVGPATQATVLRARLGRMRSTVSELLRRRHSAETHRLRRALAADGKVDRRCACGTGDLETYAHWRVGCQLSAAQMDGVVRVASGSLAVRGCAFWFDVEQRVGYWRAASDMWVV